MIVQQHEYLQDGSREVQMYTRYNKRESVNDN